MKKIHIVMMIILAAYSGCTRNKQIYEQIPESVKKTYPSLTGYWLDEETGTVHTISAGDGSERVTSVIKYRDGVKLEEMKIITSGYVEGKLHWIYFVPSTGYAVDLTAVPVSDNSLSIDWKNRSAEGEEDSGSDMLIRCNETGSDESATENSEEAGNDEESTLDEEVPEDLIQFRSNE